MDALINALPAKAQDLLRETEPDRITELDEDAVLALHKRVRRARNKSVKNYRRLAAGGVEEHAGRGSAHPEHGLARDRTEVFEDALARVSARLEVLAREAAEKLRDERLEAARGNGSTGPELATPDVPPGPEGLPQGVVKTTGGVKRDASSQAQGAQRQAKRDNR